MIRANKFIHIDNISVLGKFYAHHAERDTNESILFPILKKEIKEESNNQISLIPGYIDRDFSFYQCPLVSFYIKIKKYEYHENYIETEYFKERIVTLFIEVFDKKLENSISRKVTLKVKKELIPLDFQNFNHIINFINKYVESGRDINRIDFNLFNRYFPKLADKKVIAQAVKELDLRVFEDSKNRVGKDNRYWTDLEVRNLPKNEYLKGVLIDCLAKQGRNKGLTDFGLIIELNSDYIWSPTHPRRELKNYSTSSIRENLIMDLAIEFSPEEYTLSSMTVKNLLQQRV
jgi:hypothetical protein